MFELQKLYKHQSHPLELFQPRSIAVTRDMYIMTGVWVDAYYKTILDDVVENVNKVDEHKWVVYTESDST